MEHSKKKVGVITASLKRVDDHDGIRGRGLDTKKRSIITFVLVDNTNNTYTTNITNDTTNNDDDGNGDGYYFEIKNHHQIRDASERVKTAAVRDVTAACLWVQ